MNLVGSGGFSSVYQALHLRLGRTFALKQLQGKYIEDDTAARRLVQEAQLAASIGDSNICDVTDVGTDDDGSPYLVMPLLEGQTLAEALKEDAPISERRIADIASQVLSALEAAHARNIIHRDLKPANIFLTRMGDREDFVKLLDFGSSKLLESREVTELTGSGATVGTPFYMAPEQASGNRDLDHRVDLYAVGVILYEALTGIRPFGGDSYNKVMFNIISAPLDLPSTHAPGISHLLEAVIIKAMARHPLERFGSAVEMREALVLAAAAGSSEETLARSATTTVVVKPPVFGPGLNKKSDGTRRKTLLAGLTAAVVLAAVSLGAMKMLDSKSAANTREESIHQSAESEEGSPATKINLPTNEDESENNPRRVVPQDSPVRQVEFSNSGANPDNEGERQSVPAREKKGRQTTKSTVKKAQATGDQPLPDAAGEKKVERTKTIHGRFGTEILSQF